MSFLKYKDLIEENDTVILYLNPNSMYAITVTLTITDKRGKEVDHVFQTTYGALKVKDLIGKQYGSKVNLSKGWAYVLHPTPELWTLTLPHRTQIIYTPDISMIILQLDLHPDSIVVECGTGSGSLTHALARAVNPTGHVYTFDFHEQRVSMAQKEFVAHGMGDIVTCSLRDVCRDGFGEELKGQADAVFLDLPVPWLVIEHVIDVLRHEEGGRFCSFSPCMEQTQKTCASLREAGFTELLTLECLRREYSVLNRSFPVTKMGKEEEDSKVPKTMSMPCMVLPLSMPGHTGYLTMATLPPIWARDPSLSSESTNGLPSASSDERLPATNSTSIDETVVSTTTSTIELPSASMEELHS